MEEVNARYNQDIEDFFSNKFEKAFIELGNPGELLSEFLHTNYNIIIRTAVLAKKSKKHNLNLEQLKDLPILLNDPIFIFKYDNDRFTINVIIEKFNNEGMLLISLCDDDVVRNKIDIIDVITIHGNKDKQLFNKIEKDKLLYANKEKFGKFFSDSGVNYLKSEKLAELVNKYTTKNADSDTVNKKNISDKLGATEVLEQNTHTDYANYYPTYKQLSSYDSFFGTAGTNFPVEKGGLDETLKKINEVINKYNYQAAAIAKHLKADTLLQSVFNLWHFSTTNITYKLDKLGFEQLRTPNRAWHDRFTGIDCDCYAIFTSCVLLQMGYKPQLAVVAFNNNSQFGHIYTVINSYLMSGPYNLGDYNGGAIAGGIVCDPVMRTIFNKHPKGITKAKIMNIEVLNGISDNGIVGFGAIMAADATTQKFIEHLEKLKLLKRAKQPVSDKEMRKLQFMILMNGHPERNHYLEIMDLVDDIDKSGSFIFISEEAETEAVNFLDNTIGKGLTEYELSYENGKAIPVLRGLGADQLGELGSLKSAFKKVKEKVKATVKKAGEGIKKAVTKVVKVIKKIDPIMLSMRGGLLLAISLNYRNITKRLYIAMMTPDELKKAGYTSAVQVALKPSLEHAKKIFKKLGGEEKNLISTIKKGWTKKPLFGKPGKGIQGIEEFEGLGVAPLIATALAAILAIVQSLTNSKAPLKPEDDDHTDTDSPENRVPGTDTADFNKMMLGPDPEPGIDPDSDGSSSGSNNKIIYYVGGGVLLLGLGVMALKPKNK